MAGAKTMRSGTTRFDDYEAVEYMVEQALPWPGQFAAARRTARLAAEAEGLRYLETRRNVLAQVQDAYWSLWQARQAVAVTRDSLQLAARMESSALGRYEAGSGAQADVLRAQIERLRLGTEVAALTNEAGVALARLNALLDADPAAPRLTGDPPPLPPPAPDLAALQAQARAGRFRLLAAARDRAAGDAGIREARLARRPGFLVRAEARHFTGGSGIEEYDTGLYVNLPWPWGRKYDAMQDKAVALRAMADADAAADLDETLSELQMQFAAADAMDRERRLLEGDVIPRTDNLARSSRAAYEAGQASAFEYLDALRMRQDALLGWYRASAGYAGARARLDALTAPWSDEERATGLLPEETP